MADGDLTINFRWVADAQSQEANIARVKQGTDAFARILTRNVAIASADAMRKDAAKTLRQRVKKEVENEIARMARSIGRNFSLPDASKGPRGEMSLISQDYDRGNRAFNDSDQSMAGRNQVSEMAYEAWGGAAKFDRSQSGIKWAPRSKRYMRRRKQTGRWWRQDGELETFLDNLDASAYEGAFGAVNVVFNPRRDTTANFENINVTMSGRSGKISQNIMVGTLEVLVFNKITPQMMSGISSMNPVGSKPAHGNPGVAALLGRTVGEDNENIRKLLGKSWGGRYKRRVERTYTMANDPDQDLAAQRKKLWGKTSRKKWEVEEATANREYRPAIDPFVSFYLTRAIPNAIWRRLERFVNPRGYGEGSAGRVTNLTGQRSSALGNS